MIHFPLMFQSESTGESGWIRNDKTYYIFHEIIWWKVSRGVGGKGFCAGTSVVCSVNGMNRQKNYVNIQNMWRRIWQKICFHAAGIIFRGRSHILATAPITAKGKRLSCLLYEATVKMQAEGSRDDGLLCCMKRNIGYKKCVDDNSGEWSVSGCFFAYSQWAETGFTSVWRSGTGVSGYRNVFK